MSEPDFKRAKHAKLAEVRVTLSATERAEWIRKSTEVSDLKDQVHTINNDPDVHTTEEHDLIIKSLKQKAAEVTSAAML